MQLDVNVVQRQRSWSVSLAIVEVEVLQSFKEIFSWFSCVLVWASIAPILFFFKP